MKFQKFLFLTSLFIKIINTIIKYVELLRNFQISIFNLEQYVV